MPALPAVAVSRRLRVLLANVTLAGRTGTETATRGLALGLLAAGHRPMVYAPALGGVADELRTAGIPVVDRLNALPEPPDLIHGHHHVETMTALLCFAGTQAVFVCHDRTAVASAPPLSDRIRRYVSVDLNCLERLTTDYGIPRALTSVIPNAIEMNRFKARAPLPARPLRAAIFSNYAEAGTHLEYVQDACARLSLPLDVIGSGVGNEQAAPELLLGSYDLVFAKARCALEAMAVGCAVVLCDATGLGTMVTSREVENLRAWNFGRRTLRSPLDRDAILSEVNRYDADDAATVSRWIRQHARIETAVEAYLSLYAAIDRDPAPARSLEEDMRDYVSRTMAHIGTLDALLAEYRRPFRMEALSDDECRRVTVRVRTAPATGLSGAMLRVTVEVQNGLAVPMGTFPPYPVDLSYRWIDTLSGALVVTEGARTALPAIAPGGSAVHAMKIAAPGHPGEYRLRVALVQEGLRWLDYLSPPVADEVTVSVADPAGSSPT